MSSIDIIHKVMSSLEVVVEEELNKCEDSIEKIAKDHLEEREKLEERIDELLQQTHNITAEFIRFPKFGLKDAVEYEDEFYIYDSILNKLWVLDCSH